MDLKKLPRANLVFLNLYVLTLGLGGINLGFAFAGNNQTANILAAKFEWDEEETKFYNSIVNFSAVLGLAIGSFSGGLIIPWGRRKTLLLFNGLTVLSIALTLFLYLPTIVAGKLLFGFCSGVINTAAPKMLDETVPEPLLGAFGIATNGYICFGIFLT